MSNDLQVAKVFLYFSGDDNESRMFAFENLQRKTGYISQRVVDTFVLNFFTCRYIRKELSQKVKMRRAPEVRLIYDKSIEEQEKVTLLSGVEAYSNGVFASAG